MKISERRLELLGQHNEIRRLITEVGLALGDDHRGALPAAIGRLQRAVDAHNRHEDALLSRLLPTVDAWGEARAWWMDRRHHEEHAEVMAALDVAVGGGSHEKLEVKIRELLGQMSANLSREELEFLSPEVLNDEKFKLSDGFGG